MLSRDRFHVLHFDLRIPGFADVYSLYMRLSQQMEHFFEDIATSMPGLEEFRKDACAFKVGFPRMQIRIGDARVLIE